MSEGETDPPIRRAGPLTEGRGPADRNLYGDDVAAAAGSILSSAPGFSSVNT